MKTTWKDLSPLQKKGILTLAAVQITLLIAALVDIARRPANQIRGRKRWWVLGSFVEFFGPLTYFFFGRKQPEDRKDFI